MSRRVFDERDGWPQVTVAEFALTLAFAVFAVIVGWLFLVTFLVWGTPQ